MLTGPDPNYDGDRDEIVSALFHALQLGMVGCYAQGLTLIGEASRVMKFGVNLAEVARIWKAGCIIRSRMLDPIKKACAANPNLVNLMMDEAFRKIVNANQADLRRVVSLAAETGVPATCLGATLAYIDSYRSEFLPANLLQAQRDLFGAHTYRRLDKEGVFHTEWED